jgi:hypothetical protein
MMNRIDQWLMRPAPAARLATLRILCASYAVIFLLVRIQSFWQATSLPSSRVEGVGVLWFLDERLPPSAMRVAIVACVVLGLLVIGGIRHRVTGPLFAILFLIVATYRLSFGHVIHTEHLIVIHLLIIGFSPAADARSLGTCRRNSGRGDVNDHERYGVPIRLMIVVLVITYVLAGWAKIRHGGTDWLFGDVLRNQVAYDNLRKELLGSPHSPLGGWLVRFDWLFPPAAIATSVVELGAIVVLVDDRRTRWVWAIGAWAFHAGVLATMAISFPYPLSFVAYAPLFAVEHLRPMRRRAFTRRPMVPQR